MQYKKNKNQKNKKHYATSNFNPTLYWSTRLCAQAISGISVSMSDESMLTGSLLDKIELHYFQ